MHLATTYLSPSYQPQQPTLKPTYALTHQNLPNSLPNKYLPPYYQSKPFTTVSTWLPNWNGYLPTSYQEVNFPLCQPTHLSTWRLPIFLLSTNTTKTQSGDHLEPGRGRLDPARVADQPKPGRHAVPPEECLPHPAHQALHHSGEDLVYQHRHHVKLWHSPFVTRLSRILYHQQHCCICQNILTSSKLSSFKNSRGIC